MQLRRLNSTPAGLVSGHLELALADVTLRLETREQLEEAWQAAERATQNLQGMREQATVADAYPRFTS